MIEPFSCAIEPKGSAHGEEARGGPAAEVDLQERMIALIRAFGLHQPDKTPAAGRFR
jgi:hypothetical protein